MYISGAIIGFVLGFIVFMIQGIKRRQESDESLLYVLAGSLFGAVITAFLSWLSVAVIVLMILNGKAWGISDRNL